MVHGRGGVVEGLAGVVAVAEGVAVADGETRAR